MPQVPGRKTAGYLQNDKSKIIYDYNNTKNNIQSDLLNFAISF